MRYLPRISLAIALTLLSSAVWAGTISFKPYACELPSTSTAVVNTQSNSVHPYGYIEMGTSGGPSCVFHFTYPSAAGANVLVQVDWMVESASTNNGCFTVSVGVLPAGAEWSNSMAYGGAGTQSANAGSSLLNRATSSPFVVSNNLTHEQCTATDCQGMQGYVRVTRNNGCSNNLSSNVLRVIGIQLVY